MNTESISTPRHGKEVRFGDLILAFTSQFEHRWSDTGSGAVQDVSFYHPVPPTGFHALGSICIGNSRDSYDPNDKIAVLCVKAVEDVEYKPSLVRAEKFQCIWNDAGSRAFKDGSCWRPIAPPGYVALGDVFVEGYAAPSLHDVMCVAEELVVRGSIGECIWTDRGSGADRDFGAWRIDPSLNFSDPDNGIFSVGGFVGYGAHEKLSSDDVRFTLRLPLPTIVGGEAQKPSLKSRDRPADTTTPVVDRIVTVPFTAVIDDEKTFAWKLQNSPFYDVERTVYYDLLVHSDNPTSRAATATSKVTTGIGQQSSEYFSLTTGIKVTAEAGVKAGIFSSKAAIEMSKELGYATGSTTSAFKEETVSAELIVPPQHSGALWMEAHDIHLIRADNTTVGSPLSFKESNTSYLLGQFPPPLEGSSGTVKQRRLASRLR